MKLAIISDIHSNSEALLQALNECEKEQVDEILCLGDIVGYGANPNECVELIRDRCSVVILGNHDMAIYSNDIVHDFNIYAYRAIEWTKKHLHPEFVSYLKQRPLKYGNQNALYVHSSPVLPEEWDYILSRAQAAEVFRYFEQDVCFIGHTHQPDIFFDGNKAGEKFPKRRLINVGSVGQPRDGDSRLSFGIFDDVTFEYRNVRLEYDVETAAKKIIQAGLPAKLGERLYIGR